MKASELRALAVDELVQKSRELQGEYFNVKVKHTTGQLENTAKLKQLRREVARVATVLQQKREATG